MPQALPEPSWSQTAAEIALPVIPEATLDHHLEQVLVAVLDHPTDLLLQMLVAGSHKTTSKTTKTTMTPAEK